MPLISLSSTTLHYPRPGWVQMSPDAVQPHRGVHVLMLRGDSRKGYDPADTAAIMGDGTPWYLRC